MPLAVCLLVALWVFESTGLILQPKIPETLKGTLDHRSTFQAGVLEAPQPTIHGAKTVAGVEGTKVLLNTPFSPSWKVGDTLLLEARLKRPARYKNPGDFDFRRELGRRGIALTAFIAGPERVTLLHRPPGSLGENFLSSLQGWIQAKITQHLSPRAASLLSALFLGNRSGITEEVWSDFRKTGTAHLLSISGQHVVIVSLFFYVILLWLLKRSVRLMLLISVRKAAALLVLFPVWGYIFVAGSPPSAIRAGMMATGVTLALLSQREPDTWSALSLAAILMTLSNISTPFSASFQLSFLAVVGILLFQFKITRGPTWIRKYLFIPLTVSVGASLTTLPLVAYRFHILSLSGIFHNLWAVPACGCLLIACPLLMLVGFYSLADFLAQWFLRGIEFAAHYSLSFPVFPTLQETAFIYGLILVVLLVLHQKVRPLSAFVLLSVLLLVSIACSLLSSHRNRLEVTFLDVGQGDGALIVSPSGKATLVDGGGFLITGQGPPPFDLGREIVRPYLGRRGIRQVDQVILSHPHPDHYGGLTAIIQDLPVKRFFSNGQAFPDVTFRDLIQMIEVQGIPQRTLAAGDSWPWEGGRFEVLYPDRVDPRRDINDNSLVLRFTYGETTFLLTGDIEREGEKFLAGLPVSLPTSVLKIPHHASRTSSSIPFIDKVLPTYAVASLGEENFFGFPHPDILERYERRGTRVFRTDRDGAVTFLTDGKTVQVKSSFH